MTPDLLSHSDDPDVQEALSARYVVGVRLLLLDSGHVAVFDRDGLQDIVPNTFDGDIITLLQHDKQRIDAVDRAYEERQMQEKIPLQTTANLGDLDL